MLRSKQILFGTQLNRKKYFASPVIHTESEFLAHVLSAKPGFEQTLVQTIQKNKHQALDRISTFEQKSKSWHRSRKLMLTGSITGALVGHSLYKHPFNVANDLIDSIEGEKNENRTQDSKVMVTSDVETVGSTNTGDAGNENVAFAAKGYMAPADWGSSKEAFAIQCYLDHFSTTVTLEWFKQYKKNSNLSVFTFRGQDIPHLLGKKPPVVTVRHYNLLIDFDWVFRGVSPDGIVFINDVAVGCVEIKCSVAKRKDIHATFRMRNYDQVQNQIYVCQKYWPTIRWNDYVNWNPTLFTSETIVYDPEYYLTWYKPRELRFLRMCIRYWTRKLLCRLLERSPPIPSNQLESEYQKLCDQISVIS
jgi:hypothetical protein